MSGGLRCEKRHLLCAIYILKRTFYQDRLGTNIGKALKKEWRFSQVYLPYYHYHTPAESYPVAVKAGDNLSFPRKRVCNETQELGTSEWLFLRLMD